MCGIAGIVYTNALSDPKAALHNMLDAMSHRGPDARGVFHEEMVSLGHQRLSVLDPLERGNQPMTDHTGRYTLVHNGEIYNFRELRKELDYPWKTETDTEMILAAYQKWGPDCLHRFNGMFAFALWDNVEQELFVARDRMGIKPLYYFIWEGGLAFASEVRALTKVMKDLCGQIPKVNREKLADYLMYQTTYGSETMVEQIQILEPGQYFTDKPDTGEIDSRKWWNVFDSASDEGRLISPVEVKSRVKELLSKAVERRLISDVPLGAFLSGGIDSSAIVALMSEVSSQPVETFSVVFEEKEYDESKWSEMIACQYNTRHHPILVKPTDFLEALPAALKSMDHPSGDGINSYVVSQITREKGITVALSGLGGDELFAGYPIFNQLPAIQNKKSLWMIPVDLRKLLRHPYGWLKKGRQAEKIKAVMALKSPEMEDIYQVFRTIYPPKLAHKLAPEGLPNSELAHLLTSNREGLAELPLLSKISAAEIASYTQSVLLRDTDQMSMAQALEVRVPFFDHELVEFVLGVPDAVKRPDYPKKLLVESLGDLLPHDLVHRKKMGFVFPWEQWLRHELRDFCDLRIRKLQDNGLIDADLLGQVWKEFQAGEGQWLWTHIWLPVVLQEWMDNNGIEA